VCGIAVLMALSVWRAISPRQPRSADPILLLNYIYSAIAYAAARQLDSARAAAQRFSAVATDGNRATANTLNGFIALQANDAAGAITALSQANPNDVLSKELLAEAQVKQGRRAEAQALRETVVKNATMVAGGRILDLFILVAKQRAKAG
jgi:hypothetical protein